MTPYQQLRRFVAGAVCLMVIPAAALASGQQGQPPYHGGDPERERKVDALTERYMREAFGISGEHVHDERDHMTPAAINNLTARAQAGDADAMGQMGYNYQYGLGVEKNERMAVDWYKRAIEYGGKDYHSAIGDIYRDYGTEQKAGLLGGIRGMLSGQDKNALEKDNAIAREWYEKGIQHDDWRAYEGLAELYRDGLGGVSKDLAVASSYYKQSTTLKKQRDEREMLKLKRDIRMRAEAEVPFNPNAAGAEEASAPRAAVPEQRGQTVRIGGEACDYALSQISRRGYMSVYEARCPHLRGKQLPVDKVALPGLRCDIERSGQGSSLLLLCNAEEMESIRIGSANCSLRPERKESGFAAVYGAYCNKAAEADVEPVTYQDMECQVTPSDGQGKTYTLKCGAAQPQAAPQAESRPTVTQRIGQYTCSLREAESPDQAYAAVYEAYCGGLDAGAKHAPSIPGSIPVGVRLCEVEPWPANSEAKDFELYCR